MCSQEYFESHEIQVHFAFCTGPTGSKGSHGADDPAELPNEREFIGKPYIICRLVSDAELSLQHCWSNGPLWTLEARLGLKEGKFTCCSWQLLALVQLVQPVVQCFDMRFLAALTIAMLKHQVVLGN